MISHILSSSNAAVPVKNRDASQSAKSLTYIMVIEIVPFDLSPRFSIILLMFIMRSFAFNNVYLPDEVYGSNCANKGTDVQMALYLQLHEKRFFHINIKELF